MKAALAAGGSAAGVMALTAVHHAYGAVRFATPWRQHVVHVSVWVILSIAVCVAIQLRATARGTRRAGLLLGCTLILLGPVAWIGVFEGGYNHVLKNVLYFGGVSRDSFQSMFPPPDYVPPSDWLFELTGVLQFPFGLIVAGRVVRWWRNSAIAAVPET